MSSQWRSMCSMIASSSFASSTAKPWLTLSSTSYVRTFRCSSFDIIPCTSSCVKSLAACDRFYFEITFPLWSLFFRDDLFYLAKETDFGPVMLDFPVLVRSKSTSVEECYLPVTVSCALSNIEEESPSEIFWKEAWELS